MSSDPRGSMNRQGNIMFISNGLVESVVSEECENGHIIVSYAVQGRNRMTTIETIRLNINSSTVMMNAQGIPITLCNIREGMWVDTMFSPMMTRSILPQSFAFVVVARRGNYASVNVSTERVALVDANNSFFYTGNGRNRNSLRRYVVTDTTVIRDRNGNAITLRALRPGQMVRIIHSDFMTFSIPPQIVAYYVQVI